MSFVSIQGRTYARPGLQKRRLGLVAQEVEEAVSQLAIDNIISTRWYEGEKYMTLNYSRLVALCIPAITHLN